MGRSYRPVHGAREIAGQQNRKPVASNLLPGRRLHFFSKCRSPIGEVSVAQGAYPIRRREHLPRFVLPQSGSIDIDPGGDQRVVAQGMEGLGHHGPVVAEPACKLRSARTKSVQCLVELGQGHSSPGSRYTGEPPGGAHSEFGSATIHTIHTSHMRK